MKNKPTIKAITAAISLLTVTAMLNMPAYAAQIDENTKVSTKSQANDSESKDTNKDIPTSYSSLDLNIVNPVKKQKYNDCWTYSSLSVLETKIMKMGYSVNSLSAEHMNLWATTKLNGKGWQRNILSEAYAFTTLGYLSSWQGGIEESDYENLSEIYTPDTDTTNLVHYGTTAIKYLDGFTPDEIKSEIIDNGSIYAAFSHNNNYENADRTAYFCPPGSPKSVGHAVAIVGWDDNYTRENFKEINGVLPENDGAWLVKNSWGDYNSLHGYFWISYEDAFLFSDTYKYNFAIEDVKKITDDVKLMQNEIYGSTYEFKYLSDDSVTYLNLFNFSEGYNKLDSVIFESSSKGSDYEIYYVPADNKIPTADESEWTFLESGTIPYNGYINIDTNDFDLPINYGAIAVKVSKTEESDNNSIGVGEWLKKSNGTYAFYNETVRGESFIYKNGEMIDALDWYKAENQDELGGTFVIKAVTNKTEVSVTMLGDVDLNSKLDVIDATELQLSISGSTSLSAVQKLNADTNADGKISVNDVTQLQIMIAENDN